MFPTIEKLLSAAAATEAAKRLRRNIKSRTATECQALSGSAYALYADSVSGSVGGVNVFVCNDRDSAAYLINDLYALGCSEQEAMFFPTGYKRSIRFGSEDRSGVVQRTAALEALREGVGKGGRLLICTYPEAVSETVVDRRVMSDESLELKVGDEVSIAGVEEQLRKWGFEQVDFVYDPGQYSVRGGIFDIFSFAVNRPFRIDFFGDSIESIRLFEISSQLSSERVERARIVPDYKRGGEQTERVSFARFVGDQAVWWIDDLDSVAAQLDSERKKLLADSDDPAKDALRVTSAKAFADDLTDRAVVLRSSSRLCRASESIRFATSPQPLFNKQFEMLAADIERRNGEGFTTCILSDSRVQIERLVNVFASIRKQQVRFEPLMCTLHEGFVDNNLKVCLYTDHQIFDRYHRYQLRGEIDRSQSLTVAELNELKQGDYVVHIDHGVGQFGGLVKTVENGKQHEAIKLVYRDGDVLLVNVHSLHRIARYKSKDSEQPPRIYKLGTGVWQRMKDNAKQAVKDIARELIALYAQRKSGEGFAFSPDGYLQQELASSFPYEETPDQQKAVELVTEDMESKEPMDRLVCGDVGFGKTEVAVRAAFKAACDSKQVAVLVPTTILALQHYRTFSERLRGFPVKVELLSRVKSAAQVRQIESELAEGKIDIVVGTHKLLGKGVKFRSLGLLIIDEEQKFGVTAKERLRQLSKTVDTLTLTATPIPRTLQFSLMGARDLSVIATPPPNRQPIVTESHLFDEAIIKEAIDFELDRMGQVFFVHNRVESIERMAALIRRLCPKARVAVGHGQMSAQELEKLIMEFVYGEFDVLVATTIIENGIDIPNANTIIINDAQNFGLSDLHQLRGRVGRSSRKSFCYLLSPPEELLSSDSRRRLRAIEEFSDLGSGFNIAMQDLDIRGAGNLLGSQQSGFIADMGFETYQKILSEAVAELRAEGVVGVDEVVGAEQIERAAQGTRPEDVIYVTDCQIETDAEALLPDEYVAQSSEKLRLYRELDDMKDEQSMQRFVNELTDRFGKLPVQVETLVDVVRLRWRCVALGFERVKVKNGLMIVGFPADPKSKYYQSEVFMNVLHYAVDHPDRFVIKQRDGRVGLTIRKVASVEEASKLLDLIAAERPTNGNNGGKSNRNE